MDPNRDIGRHEADLVTIKIDVKEMREDISVVKEYITQRRTERRVGWLIITGIFGLGSYVGSLFPYIVDFFKVKGLH